MPKFRSIKPPIVARQFKTGTAAEATPLIQWILDNGGTARYHELERRGQTSYRPDDVAIIPEHIAIDTLEGTMRAAVGDWIIQGLQGEFYSCKPDIFANSYEELPDDKA
jgi:hypothetical protein